MRPDIYRLIPCSMYKTYMCYVVYDEYPRDKKKSKIDITVCLRGGKVVELSQRECVSSIVLNNVTVFRDIQIVRNNFGDLFYIVVADNNIIILRSTDQISVYRRISNVIRHEVCDPDCSGEAKLKIKTLTEYFIIPFTNSNNSPPEVNRDLTDSKPAISSLKIKLTEAKYNLVSLKNAYKQVEKLRQRASFLCHGDELKERKTFQPVVRFCNKKIVIQIEVKNHYDEPMKEVCVFVHNTSSNSISYTSMVYEYLSHAPFYKEIEHREIKSKYIASVVAVIPISEFKSSISSRIDFSIIVSYERQQKNYLQSFDPVHISAADVMDKNFEVFSGSEVDKYSLCIAMLSTTLKTTLCLKQKGLGDMISLSNIFKMDFKMDLMGERIMIAIHKYSPHHILHGIMIIFEDDEIIDVAQNAINYKIDVYTRSSSQVLALIHLLYDTVPLDLIVTTPNIHITCHENDESYPRNAFAGNPGEGPSNVDYTQCADSLLNQASMTLRYLDNSTVKTNMQIDLLARGSEEFERYRNNMLVEAKNTFEHLIKSSARTNDIEEIMETETDEI